MAFFAASCNFRDFLEVLAAENPSLSRSREFSILQNTLLDGGEELIHEIGRVISEVLEQRIAKRLVLENINLSTFVEIFEKGQDEPNSQRSY